MLYEELDHLIDSLAKSVANEHPQKGYWSELWKLVSRIRNELKTTNYPKAADKRAAIKHLNDLVDAARVRGETEKRLREERQREWEERKEKSEFARKSIERNIAGTRPTTNLEIMISSMILAPIMALEAIMRSAFGLEQLDALFEDLKACNGKMQEAWRVFNESKSELLPGDKHQLFQQLRDAQERLNSAWDQWKRAKNEAHQERRRVAESLQQEREEKYQNFVSRVEANIEKLEAKIAKAENALERQHANLSDLRDQYRDAWSDPFRERCSEWIDEAEERIQSIEDSIDQWKEWLQQERDKISK